MSCSKKRKSEKEYGSDETDETINVRNPTVDAAFDNTFLLVQYLEVARKGLSDMYLHLVPTEEIHKQVMAEKDIQRVLPTELKRFPYEKIKDAPLMLFIHALSKAKKFPHVGKRSLPDEGIFIKIKTARNLIAHSSPSSIENVSELKWSLEKAVNKIDTYLDTDTCFQMLSKLKTKKDDSQSQKLLTVGKISYNPEVCLGQGSYSSVFVGTFDKQEVAVKRITPQKNKTRTVEREIKQIMKNLSGTESSGANTSREVSIHRNIRDYGHDNVIRYFYTEVQGPDIFIALELCQGTLDLYVENMDDYPNLTQRKVALQIIAGVRFLHSHDIVHRDIKAANILLRDLPETTKVVISDFGQSKYATGNLYSVSAKAGTEGWIAPELDELYSKLGTKDVTDVSTASDVFSLGCVISYVFSGGKHPFDPPKKRQSKINKCDPDLSDLEEVQVHMVQQMLSKDSEERPTADECRLHPSLWTNRKVLSFLEKASDKLKSKSLSKLRLKMESNSQAVFGHNWISKLTTKVANDIKTGPAVSVISLLRAIRNKSYHYDELPSDVQSEYGTYHQGFLEYWTSRFPKLLIHVFEVMSDRKEDEDMERFYPQT